MRTEVIVVGAGPAGSTLARQLAQQGISVVMLDKAVFPRDKPCGGAVSIRCQREIGIDLSPVIERTVNEVRFTLKQRHNSERILATPEHFGYLTQRRRLDAYLAEAATEAGAVFRQRTRISSVERDGDTVTVRASGGQTFQGRVLVAADGANGVAGRMAGVNLPEHRHSVALEGNIHIKAGFPAKWKHAIGLNFGDIKGGYGWIFPKGDHLNIGLGGYKHMGPQLRARLRRLVKFWGYDPEALWGVRGHYLPWRREASPIVDGNVALVGDAAALLDPLTGEGIHAAVRSAKLAGASIAGYLDGGGGEKASLESYAKDLEEDILADIRVSRTIHNLFYGCPVLFFRAQNAFTFLFRAIARVFYGDVNYSDLPRQFAPLWPVARVFSRLVRPSLPSPKRKS